MKHLASRLLQAKDAQHIRFCSHSLCGKVFQSPSGAAGITVEGQQLDRRRRFQVNAHVVDNLSYSTRHQVQLGWEPLQVQWQHRPCRPAFAPPTAACPTGSCLPCACSPQNCTWPGQPSPLRCTPARPRIEMIEWRLTCLAIDKDTVFLAYTHQLASCCTPATVGVNICRLLVARPESTPTAAKRWDDWSEPIPQEEHSRRDSNRAQACSNVNLPAYDGINCKGNAIACCKSGSCSDKNLKAKEPPF